MKILKANPWILVVMFLALSAAGCMGDRLREHVQDRVQAVLQASDGSYLVLAEKHYVDMPEICFENCSGEAVSHLWVLRLSPDGDVLWEKTFRKHRDDYVEAGGMAEVEEGRFVVAAWSSRVEGLWLLCIDEDGDLVWETSESSNLVSYYPLTVEGTADAQVRIAGIALAGEAGPGHNVRVMTVDAEGDVTARMESVTLPGDMQRLVDLEPGADGGVTVLAELEEPDPRTDDGYPQLHYTKALRVNASGRIAWELELDPLQVGETRPQRIVQTASGHALIANECSAVSPAMRLYLIDDDGAVQGEVTFDGFRGHALAVDEEGALLLAGAEATGYGTLGVKKLDPEGRELWSGRFADAEGFFASTLAVTSDRGMLVGEMATARVVKIDDGGGMDWSRNFSDPAP